MTHSYALWAAHYPPHLGGLETFVENMAHELVAAGNRATVVTMQLNGSMVPHEVQPDGVDVWRLPCHSLMHERLPISKKDATYKQMFDQLLQKDVDRVLVNTRFYRHSVEALRYARQKSVPAVVLDHGSEYLTLGNPVADEVIKAYEHIITAQDKSFHPTFAGISQPSCKLLERFGIHTDVVINNAIDASAFRDNASKRDFRVELGLDSAATMVAFVGRITPEKGADVVVDAAEHLGPDFEFVLAGNGFLREGLETRNLPNAHFVGSISHPDLAALLLQSDLFVLPSRSEGFCQAVLEAGACGAIPVITNVGVVQDVMPQEAQQLILQDRTAAEVERRLRQAANLPENAAQSIRAQLSATIESRYSWPEAVRSLERAFEA
jgi:glycosyltransferase involved in cell wall biosynthesis